jgi:hypothetical protein
VYQHANVQHEVAGPPSAQVAGTSPSRQGTTNAKLFSALIPICPVALSHSRKSGRRWAGACNGRYIIDEAAAVGTMHYGRAEAGHGQEVDEVHKGLGWTTTAPKQPLVSGSTRKQPLFRLVQMPFGPASPTGENR